VAETSLTVACDDGPRTVARTTTQPVTQIKAHRPRNSLSSTTSTPMTWQPMAMSRAGWTAAAGTLLLIAACVLARTSRR
jgi:hypothetical protein